MDEAKRRFGGINILIANSGVTDESNKYPIWDLPLDIWEKTYRTNVRGTFLTIKHFLLSAQASQEKLGQDLDNLAIVVAGSEYGMVRSVKNEIVRLNGTARINAVAPARMDPSLMEGRLDGSREWWAGAQATYISPFPYYRPTESY
jgi:NAD(P)-dependent dehydrogenase (short-subunit alcohol dehydrogenase family)